MQEKVVILAPLVQYLSSDNNAYMPIHITVNLKGQGKRRLVTS